MPENDEPMNVLSKPFVLIRANGGSLSFARVRTSDRVKFVEQFASYKKLKLYESLAMVGSSPADLLRELKEFDARQIREGEALYWLNTPAGQVQAILYSLGSNNVEPLDAMNLSTVERLEVACGVMGVGVENERPLPLAPASGANATGGASETSLQDTAGSPNPSGSGSMSSTAA